MLCHSETGSIGYQPSPATYHWHNKRFVSVVSGLLWFPLFPIQDQKSLNRQFGYSLCNYVSADLNLNKPTPVNSHFVFHERSLEKNRDFSAFTNQKKSCSWWKRLINQWPGTMFIYLPTPALLPGQRTENITQDDMKMLNKLSQMLHSI